MGKLMNIGFGNVVNTSKVIAIINPDSAPIKRMIQNAKDAGMAIDATQAVSYTHLIYCCNDTMALGALQAVINENKLGEIFVVGTDGDTEAVDSVNKGELSATVAQDPAGIGAKGLELLVEAVQAGNKGEVGVVPDMTPVDSVLVTKE